MGNACCSGDKINQHDWINKSAVLPLALKNPRLSEDQQLRDANISLDTQNFDAV